MNHPSDRLVLVIWSEHTANTGRPNGVGQL